MGKTLFIMEEDTFGDMGGGETRATVQRTLAGHFNARLFIFSLESKLFQSPDLASELRVALGFT